MKGAVGTSLNKGSAKGTKNRKSSGGFKKGVEAGKIGNNNAKKKGKKKK